jgi:glycosyltransferase involved in cell wall biosynthesis
LNLLTVAVTANNDRNDLKYTLDSLVAQTSEDFDVIIVLNGENEETKALATEFADEYDGFTVLPHEKAIIPVCRNFAAANAKTEYLMFMDEGDYLSPESVEKLLEVMNKSKPDIITTRYYISGEGEPVYEHWNDLLSTVPNIDRFDRALLQSFMTEGRVYKKKFFDLYPVGFPENPAFYTAEFTAKCVFDYGASVSGCAGAIYDRRKGIYRCGFDEQGEPNEQNLNTLINFISKCLDAVKAITKETTGAFDGDEYAYQEMLFIGFTLITDCFYRYFWYITDDMLVTIRKNLELLSNAMTEKRKSSVSEEFADIRFPAMYMSHADAARMPYFSLIADFKDDENTTLFMRSLYISRFPFFEIFLKESAREFVPENLRTAENMHFCPDNTFFADARTGAAGVQISVKDNSPLDTRTLSELATAKIPRGLMQYMFGVKRKKYATKTYLKSKGFNIR